jgi:hypothetical protein
MLLTKSGLRSYAVGLGTDIQQTNMEQVIVGGGYYRAAANSSAISTLFNDIARSVVASAQNVVFNTQYDATTRYFRLKILAKQTATSSTEAPDYIIFKVEEASGDFVLTIVQRGTYSSFEDNARFTVLNPGTIQRRLQVDLNNLNYTRNNVDYVIDKNNISVDMSFSASPYSWQSTSESQVTPDPVQKKIGVVLVLDCSTSLDEVNAFPIVKSSANNFIDILAQ